MSVDQDFRLYRTSRMSARFGIAACGFGLAGHVTCCWSHWPALLFGLLGLVMAIYALQDAGYETPDRAYAKVGAITSVLAVIWAIFYLSIQLFYVFSVLAISLA